MRALLIPFGSAGDVHPFVGIGTELKKRGHDVIVISNANFRSVIENAGLKFVELGTAEEFHRIAANPDLWNPRKSFFVIADGVAKHLRPMYDLIQQLNIPGKTVVVAGSLSLAARIAQEKMGIPTAMVHLQPASFRSVNEPPILPGLAIPKWFPPFAVKMMYGVVDLFVDNVLGSQVNKFREELGLPPARSIMGTWWNSPQLTLGLFPDWFFARQKEWPNWIQLTGFPLFDGEGVEPTSTGLEEFLSAGAPPVVFTAGSAMKTGDDFFRASVAACRELKCRGILVAKYAEQIPLDLPPGVKHFSYLPFGRVFPHAAVAVHHGGIGTTAQSFAAGVPQLVMPLSHDQFDNGARVQKLGAGLTTSRSQYAGNAARLLKRLIDEPSFKLNARAIAGKVDKALGLQKTCDFIEKLL